MNICSELSGGLHASFSIPQCANIFKIFAGSDMFKQILIDYPRLAREEIRFFDAGAGLHLPGVMAAISMGWKAIGVEIDPNRVALAAGFLRGLLGSDIGKNLQLGYQQRDLTSPMNLKGILWFLMWDKVRMICISSPPSRMLLTKLLPSNTADFYQACC